MSDIVLCASTRRAQIVPADTAAQWLLGSSEAGRSYNRQSVRLYDLGRVGGSVAVCDPLRVTFVDLGRMACLGASLRYKSAQGLLTHSSEAPWPEEVAIPALDASPELDDDSFLRSPGVGAAWGLVDFLCTVVDGVSYATASKLLHLKWPSFFPIVDSEFRNVYSEEAVRLHNASAVIVGSRQRTRAELRAYWLAFRHDLIYNRAAIHYIRMSLDHLATSEGDRAYANDLQGLTDLRLVDMVVWGGGSGRIS